MSTTAAGSGGRITLDELIALNDEMAALARAGVPLDRGLRAASRDMRGRAGALAARLGGRIELGDDLGSALGADGRGLPAFYLAVVEAGVRSGRLSKALEGLAGYARGFAETRRAIGLALLYPVLVLLLAYALFVAFVLAIAPRLRSAFETFRLGRLGSLEWLAWLGDHPGWWAPVLPGLVAILAAWWVGSGRASALRPGRLTGLLRLIPGLRTVLASAQAGDFADLLALMVDHGVPLDRGIALAAEATGAPALRASALMMAEGLRRGEPVGSLVAARPGLPPMLAWVLATGGALGPLGPALRDVGASYRGRAARMAETLRATLPALLLCVVGALAAVVYTVAVFHPVTTLWYDLALPLPQ